jgi:hypothetical protein
MPSINVTVLVSILSKLKNRLYALYFSTNDLGMSDRLMQEVNHIENILNQISVLEESAKNRVVS